MKTNEPNLAAGNKIYTGYDPSNGGDKSALSIVKKQGDGSMLLLALLEGKAADYVQRLSEALAVARSGLEFYSDGLHYNHVNDDETFLLDYGAKAEKTIAQIDKITGVKAESQGSEGGNE